MNLDSTSIEAIVAVFLPLLIAIVKKAGWPQAVNALIAVAVYVVAGVAAVVVSGQPIDPNNIVPSVTLFTTVGTVAYASFWKNWGDPQVVAKVLP